MPLIFFFFLVVHFGIKLNTIIQSFEIIVGKQLSHVRLSKDEDCSK